MSEEDATTVCSGGEINGFTLKELASSKFADNLKTNNVIKNVVTSSSEIAITDYNIDIGGIDIVIPSTIDGKTVVAIGTESFYTKVLSTETSMLSKGNIQFMSNKEDNELAAKLIIGDIKSVVIPSTVKSIGRFAFAYNQLTTITIPKSVTSISEYAFAYNQITSVIIESADTVIDNTTFGGNSLTSVIIDGVEQITGE